MDKQAGITRRKFLKAAVIGMAAISFPLQNFKIARAFGDHPQEKPAYQVIKKIPQVCARACECDCAYYVVVGQDLATGLERAITLEGRPEDPVSRGKYCIKGMAFVDALYNPDRLLVSLKRTTPKAPARGEELADPGWVTIPTSQAADEIIAKLATMKPEEVLLASPGDPYTNRLAKSLGWTRSDQRTECFGTHYYINVLGITNPPNKYYSSTYTPSHHVAGYDYDNAAYQIWFGFESYSKAGKAGILNHYASAKKKGCKVVSFNPITGPVGEAFAKENYKIRPGTDLAVALAMIKTILDHQAFNQDFAIAHTDLAALVDTSSGRSLGDSEKGHWYVFDPETKKPVPIGQCQKPALMGSFQVELGGKKIAAKTVLTLLAEKVKGCTPEWAAKLSDVPAKDIARIALEFAKAAPRAFVPTYKRDAAGPNYANSWRLRHCIHILNTLTGAIDHEGGILLLHGVKVPWLEDVDPPKAPFPPQPAKPVDGRREFPVTWKIYSEKDFSAPGHYGMAGFGLYHGSTTRCVFFRNPHRGLFAMIGSPMLEEALVKMELVVDWNLYLDDVGYFCDYVLPAPHQFEEGKFDIRLYFPKWPCFVGGTPVQKSPGDTIGWGGLAKKMGLALAPKYWTTDGSSDPAKAIKGNMYDPALKAAGAAETYADFMAKGGLWIDKQPYHNYRTLGEIGYGGRVRTYFDQFAEVGHEPLPVWAPQWHTPEGDYKFHLLVTRAPWHMHADPNFINNQVLKQISSKNFIDCAWLHPAAAQGLGLKEGDTVILDNNPKFVPECRRPQKTKVHLTTRIRQDCVMLFHGVGHRAKNLRVGAGFGARDGDLIPQKDPQLVKKYDPTGMGWVEDVYVSVRKA